MHPFVEIIEGEGVPVVNTLAEYCRFRERNQEDDPYLAPIGRVVSEAHPACFHLSTCIRPREVYYISETHKMSQFLRRYTNWTIHSGRFYFVFISESYIEWKEMDVGARSYLISVKEGARQCQTVSVVGQTYPQMWARTVFDLQTFDVSSPLTLLLLRDYVEALGPLSSLSYFPDRESIQPPSETSMKWGGQEFDLWKKYHARRDVEVIPDAYENPLAWRTIEGEYLIHSELQQWGSLQHWMEKSESEIPLPRTKMKRGRASKIGGRKVVDDDFEELRNSDLSDRYQTIDRLTRRYKKS